MTLVRFRRPMPNPVDFTEIFNDFFNQAVSNIPTRAFQNAVNVWEDEKKIVLEVALPGIDKKDVDIQLNEDLLEIKVVKEETKEESQDNYLRKEFDFTAFERTFHLPDTVDPKKIEAKFDNGVLHITMQKKEEVIIEPKKIKVK